MKKNEQNKQVSQFFSDLFDISKSQQEMIFISKSIWNLKAKYITKLDDKVRNRISQTLRIWHESAKAITHFKKLNDEKKKRIL